MSPIREIKMTVEDCYTCLQEICDQNGWTYEIDKKQGTLTVWREGEPPALIRVYDTHKSGRTLDPSAGRNRQFGEEICCLFEQLNHLQFLKPTWASYRTNPEEIPRVVDDLDNYAKSHGYSLVKQPPQAPHIAYIGQFSANDRPKECVTVTFHRSGTVQLQGKSYIVWDQLCEWLEKRLNASEAELVARFYSNQAMDEFIRGIITADIVKDGETLARDALGSAFNYLDKADQKYATSTFCQIVANMEYPEYSTYVMPLCKALEGYLKKVLVSFGVCRERDFNPAWNFGDYFNGVNFERKVKPRLNSAQQEDALKRLYELIPDRRNRIMHSTPRRKLELDKSEALQWIAEISDALKKHHENLDS